MDPIYSIIIGVVVIAMILIYIYNGLVRFKLRASNAFSQIDVQLKRRYDLIPNLVETAKGYLKHERETLDAVVKARNSASELLSKLGGNLPDKVSAEQLGKAEQMLTQAMGQLSVTVEAYPELKASANMLQLNEELSSTENKISFSRQAFNDAVNAYNEFRQSFPSVVFASMLGHRVDLEFLTFAEGEKLQEAPTVSF